MRLRPGTKPLALLFVLAALAVVPVRGQFAALDTPASASVIPQADLVQPQQLHQELQAHTPLLILQVGSKVLFQEAHIPGAEYAGPASTAAGLAALRTRVQHLPRSQAIVIYCGCCPWDRCPNIGTAWRLLHSMGFTKVRALYLANNFGSDWVGVGYHVVSSE